MKNPEKAYYVIYFEKEMVQGRQKQCSQVFDIQIHKYTNTFWVKFEYRPNMCNIFEKVMVRGPQKQCYRVSDMQIQKYNYTNTEIHKYSLSVGHANTQIQLHKYTNTVWVKVADRPNMCYIFEKVME